MWDGLGSTSENDEMGIAAIARRESSSPLTQARPWHISLAVLLATRLHGQVGSASWLEPGATGVACLELS